MKVAWIRRHAFMAAAALLLLTIFGGRAAAAAAATMASGLLVWGAFLNNDYARALAGRSRSTERAAGDRAAGKALALASVPPLLYAASALWFEQLQLAPELLGGDQRTVVAVAAAFALCFVFASTVTDWYYIRPRRDGVVEYPPCRRENREPWVDITRWWILHRTLSATVFFLALWLVIGLGWFEASRSGSRPTGSCSCWLSAARL